MSLFTARDRDRILDLRARIVLLGQAVQTGVDITRLRGRGAKPVPDLSRVPGAAKEASEAISRFLEAAGME